MESSYLFIFICLIFSFLVSFVGRIKDHYFKSNLTAFLNLSGLVFFTSAYKNPMPFLFYVGVVVIHFYYTHSRNELFIKKIVGPVLYPILFIFVIKYTGIPGQIVDGDYGSLFFAAFFLGLSYVSFRMSFYSHRYSLGTVKAQSLSEYLSYVFFLPGMMVGPITDPSTFFNTWRGGNKHSVNYTYALERISIGIIKFTVLAEFFHQSTFPEVIIGHIDYGVEHVFLAGFSYYLYMYFNFSGFCDVVIALGHLAGVDLEENFNRPFWARNIQEFWKRWHMTLSNYMNVIVFGPLNIVLMRKFGGQLAVLTTIFCITVTFVLLGYWHGPEANYALFGLVQAIGLSVTYLYGNFLKSKLGIKKYKKYLKNKTIKVLGIALTITYESFCFVIFANDINKIKSIFKHLFFN
jgi:D-alanyl-lipoteichoic acid acyltransferase DltB (MBOAT superfamily)